MKKDLKNKELLLSGLSALMNRAMSQEYSDKNEIKSFSEYRSTQVYYESTIQVVRLFKRVEKKLYKNYLNSILSDYDTLQSILIYKKVHDCTQFYKEECKILKEVLDEFVGYTINGHIIDAILNKPRKDI